MSDDDAAILAKLGVPPPAVVAANQLRTSK